MVSLSDLYKILVDIIRGKLAKHKHTAYERESPVYPARAHQDYITSTIAEIR
jgi:hypothetical protein